MSGINNIGNFNNGLVETPNTQGAQENPVTNLAVNVLGAGQEQVVNNTPLNVAQPTEVLITGEAKDEIYDLIDSGDLTEAQAKIKEYYDNFKQCSEGKTNSFKSHHKNEIMKLSGYLCSKYCEQGNFGHAEGHFYEVGANDSNITNFMFLAKLAALLSNTKKGYDNSLFENALDYMDHAYSEFESLISTQKIKSEEDFQFKFQMCKDIPNTFFENNSLLALEKDHALLQLGFTLLSSNLENIQEKAKNILNEFSARLETGYCRDLLELKLIINDENCDLDVLNDLIFRLTNPKPNAKSLIDTSIIQPKLLNVVETLLEKKYLFHAYDLSKTVTWRNHLFSLEYLNKGSNEDIANKFLLMFDIHKYGNTLPYYTAQAINPKIKQDAFDIFIEKLVDPNRKSELGLPFDSRKSLMLFSELFR